MLQAQNGNDKTYSHMIHIRGSDTKWKFAGDNMKHKRQR